MMTKIKQFNTILKSLKINAECIDYKVIGNYTFYDIKLGASGTVKGLYRFLEEISLQLMSASKPSLEIIRDKGIVRLNFINAIRNKLMLADFVTNDDVPNGSLVWLLGQAADGSKVFVDIAKMPHCIVAGTTGSGKSCILHGAIFNALNYNNAKIFLMDPKRIEFSKYEGVFDNISVSYTIDKCKYILDMLVEVMNTRYEMMKNGAVADQFSPILVVIDELAELQYQDTDNSFHDTLCLLAQKSRAAKIHIIVATQRPSVQIISGAIKANFPARISCRVASGVDSKVILDEVGAEDLIGAGDALLKNNTGKLVRFQAAFITAEEVCSIFQNKVAA